MLQMQSFVSYLGKENLFWGKDTAVSLGVLKMGIDIASVKVELHNDGKALQQKYPNVFSGIGKLKDRLVRLPINPDVKPSWLEEFHLA